MDLATALRQIPECQPQKLPGSPAEQMGIDEICPFICVVGDTPAERGSSQGLP